MDFVDFNLAKRLKELGFNEPFFFFYREDDKDKYVHHAIIHKPLIYCDEIDNEVIIAPTISQILKWLREEKKLHIELWTVGKKPIKWCHTITTLNHVGEKQGWSSGTREDSYEAAVIAGIEYVLDNLI